MQGFAGLNRFGLRDELSSILRIIIWPAVNFRNIARPVSVTRVDRSRPLQRIGTPWVGGPYFSSLENGIEEIKDKHEVHCKHNDRNNRDELIQVIEFVEGGPLAEIHITAWHTSQSHVVHGPEDQVSAGQGYPEMEVAKRIIQVTAKHFREPVVHTGKHAEESRHTHYNMKVRNNKVSVMNVNINC